VLIDTIAKLKSRTGKRDDVRIANALAKLVRLLGIDRKREAAGPGTGTLGAILRGDHG
jgi:inorganic pyrophosphatase/exopolyphosphatase